MFASSASDNPNGEAIETGMARRSIRRNIRRPPKRRQRNNGMSKASTERRKFPQR
jgi:hypothetical protein